MALLLFCSLYYSSFYRGNGSNEDHVEFSFRWILFLFISLPLSTPPPFSLLFSLFSCPPFLARVHVPSSVWAVFLLWSLFVAILVGRKGRKVPGDLSVNEWSLPRSGWEWAEGSLHNVSMTFCLVSVGLIELNKMIFSPKLRIHGWERDGCRGVCERKLYNNQHFVSEWGKRVQNES